MLIVLEGPDLGGKSTIGRLINAEFGIVPKHSGGPPASVEELFNRVAEYRHHKVIDRHSFISEPIYSRCCGRPSKVSTFEVYNYMLETDLIVLFCVCPLEYLVEKLVYLNLKLTNKSYKSQQHVDEVIANYKCIYKQYHESMAVLTEWGVPVHKIDFRTTTQQDIRSLLNEHLGRDRTH